MPHVREAPIIGVEAVTTTAALEALGPEWGAVWEVDRMATPFQSPAWLIPWWRYIGRGALCVLGMRDVRKGAQGRLVGVLPLYIFTRPQTGRRELFPLGIATSDYLDGVFVPGWERGAAGAALGWLDGQRDRWDLLDLQQLRPESPLVNLPLPAGWSQQKEPGEPCPVLALPGCVEELAAGVPAQMLHNLQYYRRRAGKAGRVVYERADRSNWQELFEAQLALHRVRWQSRGEAGVLGGEGVEAAHRESMPQLLEAGLLRLYGLRVEGRIIATLYALADRATVARRRYYYYLGGMDPEYERLSPGTLLIGHAIEQAIDEGATAFDFLRGREAYKYLWGAVDRPVYRRCLRHALRFEAMGEEAFRPFDVRLHAVIRPCREEDLPTLEWFGLFETGLIHRIFRQHEAGEAVMLVVEVNGVASGQAWIELHRADGVGVIWALRIFPTLQRKGLGARLVGAAEQVLRQRGFRTAELAVRKHNTGARRLYERLGYRLVAEKDKFILHKTLEK